MKNDIVLIFVAITIFALLAFYGIFTSIKKSFQDSPTDMIDSAEVWEKQNNYSRETELKRKEMMENLRDQMQRQNY